MPPTDRMADAPESLGIDSAKLEALFARAEKEVRSGLLPSVQIAVARHGKIAAMRTFGRVRTEGGESEATNTTRYVVFSATKAITASAAWLLIEAGRLKLDARVADLIPEFGSHGKEAVTVEQLFTHTAGFPYAPFRALDWDDRAARLATLRDWRLNWKPGSRFEYHPTSSMWVIAELIERCADMPFRDFVRDRVAVPLGLDLGVGVPPERQQGIAEIAHVGEAPSQADFEALGFPMIPPGEVTEEALQGFNHPAVRAVGVPGAGGIMTAAELALFYQALLADGRAHDGRPVWRPETIAMARQVRTADLRDRWFGKRANRGLGIIIAGAHDRTYRGFGHTGSAQMFGHNGAGGQIAWGDPVTGISLGYCTNGMDRHPLRQARRGVAISSIAAGLLD